jgi:PIN domain nuclease of toxin-antitoxin system
MKRYFIDTNIVVMAFYFSDRLPQNIRDILTDSDTPIHVSTVSIYEIAFKQRIGKLNLGVAPIETDIVQTGWTSEAILPQDAAVAARLNWTNRDPWDRLIAAQCLRLDIPLITTDQHFSAVPLKQLQL